MSNWQPKWTTQVKIESGGRYPLGLNRFHDHLEELLIKSIIFNATRLRHFSYCCWVIGELEYCETYEQFKLAFRRYETALGMGLVLNEFEYSIAGVEAVKRHLKPEASQQTCDFGLLKRDLGVFGQYYIGSAYNFGLVERGEKGVYKLTDAGKKLHGLLDRHYRRVQPAYYREYRGAKRVPTEVLREWGQVNDYDNMRGADFENERLFYRRLILRLDQRQPSDYRRDTFAFTLWCIDHCNQHDTEFNEEILRSIHMYGGYYDSAGEIQRVSASSAFDDMLFYWGIYEGQVSFRGWLLRYFGLFTDYLKGERDGATVEQFISAWDGARIDETVSYFLEQDGAWLDGSFGQLVAAMGRAGELTDSHSELAIKYGFDPQGREDYLAQFSLVLGNLWLRFGQQRRDLRFKQLEGQLSADLWFYRLWGIKDIEQKSVREVLRTILRQFVLTQHDLVMIEKNDLRRCWFTKEGDRYVHQADPNEIWRPAKFGTIISYLHDLNLITPGMQITQEGRAFLDELETTYYRR